MGLNIVYLLIVALCVLLKNELLLFNELKCFFIGVYLI